MSDAVSETRDPALAGAGAGAPVAASTATAAAAAGPAGAAAGTAFALVILLSAFLLFAVQPLIARFILPWFGGAASVWTTCLLFFQVVLLAGYAYAHLLADRCSWRTQAVVHAVVLAACLAALPIVPSATLAPTGADRPTLRILLLLGLTVGLPYFALSATSPLVQHWFAGSYPGRSVYRLYALSNLGSLAALVSYPFLIEPALTRRAQAIGWSWLFGGFALLCAACGFVAARGARRSLAADAHAEAAAGASPAPAPTPASAPGALASAGPAAPAPLTGLAAPAPLTGGAAAVVLLFSAVASAFLLAATNKICQDVAPVPFLWVLPLTLYLIAFILCFEYADHYRRAIVMPLAAAAMLAAAYVIKWRLGLPLFWQVAAYSAALFTGCLFCLGEVARLRPAARHLTRYYLLVSLGGVVGALLVTLLAPMVFTQFLEMHACIVATWLLGLGVLLLSRTSAMRGFRRPLLWLPAVALLPVLGMMLYYDATVTTERRLLARRSFYGVIEVVQISDGDPRHTHREMIHNGTSHGVQFTHADFRRTATSYYAEPTGVGVAMRRFRADRPRRVGIVGLGTGTLAAYGKTGDEFTFYELDPDVIELARSTFTFLGDSAAKVTTVAGDARLSLARQADQRFDVLVLDAFSGDGVPVHLLTVEAFELYRRHMARGGVIAVHLSNRHLDLLPPVWAAAKRFRLAAAPFITTTQETPYPSFWLLASEDHAALSSFRDEKSFRSGPVREMRPWTDDHAPLFPVLKQFERGK